MTKIDIISGFLGAGKTTFIKKLLKEAYQGEKLVLIENEFGEISIDGGFLKDSGVQISEMSSGCICCSLVGDFGQALEDVQKQFTPDRILIEPSGVGKLSDVIRAVEQVAAKDPELKLNSYVTVADVTKCKVYMKNFGEFFNNQVESAGTIVLSRTQKASPEKVEAAVELLRQHNPDATIITTPWDQLDGAQILKAVEKGSQSFHDLLEEHLHEEEHECCDHEHHDHECCGHDHDGHDEHHHEHDHHCQDHDGHDHHDHECCSHDHHHHHADEVFTSWGRETPRQFTEGEVGQILTALDSGNYGKVLRATGIVPTPDGRWIHFDHVPEEQQVRYGSAEYTGRLCVIGSELNEAKLAELFGI